MPRSARVMPCCSAIRSTTRSARIATPSAQTREADGLIVLGHRLPKEAAALVRAMAPRCAPVVNGCEFSPKLGIPSVHIDNAKAAAEAMDYRTGSATATSVSSPDRSSARSAAIASAAPPHAPHNSAPNATSSS